MLLELRLTNFPTYCESASNGDGVFVFQYCICYRYCIANKNLISWCLFLRSGFYHILRQASLEYNSDFWSTHNENDIEWKGAEEI